MDPILALVLSGILFTVGMGIAGIAFLSFLKHSLELAELTDN